MPGNKQMFFSLWGINLFSLDQYFNIQAPEEG